MREELMAHLIVQLGARLDTDTPVINSVATRLKRGEPASKVVQYLDGIFGEEELSEFMEFWENNFPEGPKLTFTPSSGKLYGTKRGEYLSRLAQMGL